MHMLVNNGPLVIAVQADDSWMHYSGGIVSASESGCVSRVNHAVTLVGYGEENGKKYWIVRNSWSPKWGEDGHIRLERGANTSCVRNHVWGPTVKKDGAEETVFV